MGPLPLRRCQCGSFSAVPRQNSHDDKVVHQCIKIIRLQHTGKIVSTSQAQSKQQSGVTIVISQLHCVHRITTDRVLLLVLSKERLGNHCWSLTTRSDGAAAAWYCSATERLAARQTGRHHGWCIDEAHACGHVCYRRNWQT